MRLELTRSGGIGGLSETRSIDTSALEAPEAQELERLVFAGRSRRSRAALPAARSRRRSIPVRPHGRGRGPAVSGDRRRGRRPAGARRADQVDARASRYGLVGPLIVAATTTPPRKTRGPPTGARSYDAFISYSHAADGRLAPALQAGLRSLAKPWYRRRALRVFRDQTSLSASPELWSSIEEALSQARFFILLASPEAAASHWVDQEVRWWRANRSHDTFLIALTGGELRWDDGDGDFDADSADPAGASRLVSARAALGRSALGARRTRRLDAQPALPRQRRRTGGAPARRPEGRADRRGHQPASADAAARPRRGGSSSRCSWRWPSSAGSWRWCSETRRSRRSSVAQSQALIATAGQAAWRGSTLEHPACRRSGHESRIRPGPQAC